MEEKASAEKANAAADTLVANGIQTVFTYWLFYVISAPPKNIQ